jgi:hypothetical protein
LIFSFGRNYFLKHLNKVGIGIWKGQFILVKTEWFTPIFDVNIGEALSFFSALP